MYPPSLPAPQVAGFSLHLQFPPHGVKEAAVQGTGKQSQCQGGLSAGQTPLGFTRLMYWLGNKYFHVECPFVDRNLAYKNFLIGWGKGSHPGKNLLLFGFCPRGRGGVLLDPIGSIHPKNPLSVCLTHFPDLPDIARAVSESQKKILSNFCILKKGYYPILFLHFS